MNQNVLEESKNALECLDAEGLLACYGESFQFHDTAFKQRITEREELKEYFLRLFAMPSVRFTDIKILEGEDWAVIEWIWWGSARASGHIFRIPGVSVINLVDGKIQRETIYYDPRPSL